MATVEESLLEHLAGDTALADLVGGRIFPNDPPDYDAPTPFVFYQVTDADPEPLATLDGPSTAAVYTVEFTVAADQYADAKAVELALMSRLSGFAGGQVQRCLWTGSSSQPTEAGYLYDVRFRIWGGDAAIVPTQLGLPRVEVLADGLYFGGRLVGPFDPPTVAGTRGGNAALASLLNALASLGVVVDGTTA